MQYLKIWIVLLAAAGGLITAGLSWSVLGLEAAHAQRLNEFALVVVVPSQIVERIEGGSGNELGPGKVEANIHIGDDGSAKGHTQVTLNYAKIQFDYNAGRVIYDEAGLVSHVELSGTAEVTGAERERTLDFTAILKPERGSPDCVIWDITGGDVTNFHFETEGKIKVKLNGDRG